MDELKELEIELNDDGESMVWQCPDCGRSYPEDVGQCGCNLGTY